MVMYGRKCNLAITKYFMPNATKTLGNSKARACESLGFVHKKGCARVLTQPLFVY